MSYRKLIETDYGVENYRVARRDDTLDVILTYPPRGQGEDYTAGRVRYVEFDQEATRASDGVRLHYDYDRDGYVVEQPRPRLVAVGPDSYSEERDWVEVGFFSAWACNERDNPGEPSSDEFARADAELAARSKT